MVFLDDNEKSVEGARLAGLTRCCTPAAQAMGRSRVCWRKVTIMMIPNGPLAPPGRPDLSDGWLDGSG